MNQHFNLRFLLQSITAVLLLCAPSFAQQTERTFDWDSETVELFQTLPVQAGGRVKPMDSIAGLNLLTFNGKRTLKLADGTRLSAPEWLMDVMFFPEQAKTYPCFRIQSDEVLVAIDVPAKKKRDWYSYNELLPGLQRLEEQGSKISDIDPKERTAAERQILKLARDIHEFNDLVGSLDIARFTFSTNGTQTFTDLLGEPRPGIMHLLENSAAIQEVVTQSRDGANPADFDAAQALFAELDNALTLNQHGLTFMPPPVTATDQATWWRLSDLILARFQGVPEIEMQMNLYASLEHLEHVKNDQTAFQQGMKDFHAKAVAMAEARGEYDNIPLEVKLYKADVFWNSLYMFIVAFLLCAVTWMAPRQRWLWWLAWALVLAGFSMDAYGITMRCIIRHRPPVVTLYDTILFITTSIVLVAMLIEWITKQRIALPVAALLGAAGMFFAGKYELQEIAKSGDTMASVVAVLDTNYYLAIHVTTIALGYAGGLLAGGLAHLWVLAKLFGFRKNDPKFYQGLMRMTYGVVCFSLLFAVFGTIMGGVWANDSWGRFWGWDPKENGALLICLWFLLILHARLGGYVREHGFMVLCILGAVVVSVSWWGVNLLSVGLHSYGFTSGALLALMTFWCIEAAFILISVVQRAMTGWNGPPSPPAQNS
jgi:ABC-type transport system involved in cytochrome c biogenesis permease subunit